MVQISFSTVLCSIHIFSGLVEHSGLWLWRIEDLPHLGKGPTLMDKLALVLGGCLQRCRSDALSKEPRRR